MCREENDIFIEIGYKLMKGISHRMDKDFLREFSIRVMYTVQVPESFLQRQEEKLPGGFL